MGEINADVVSVRSGVCDDDDEDDEESDKFDQERYIRKMFQNISNILKHRTCLMKFQTCMFNFHRTKKNKPIVISNENVVQDDYP
ncbi:unnamed protein product [Brachionus calyciflorus]|uniref:Uncharacterized protein n=1 Tax=Brachionus calyciflorus TaxID=104777 RepID=A0A814N7S7_9BILA|nr:unnamed protein product [Brachionus calyciflorus]